LVCAGVWLAAYLALVAKTYRLGVYMYSNDRLWRVWIGLGTAALVAGAFLAWRRRERFARLSLAAAQIVILLLGIGMAAGVLMLLAFLAEEPRA
jgi:hypothetical protein